MTMTSDLQQVESATSTRSEVNLQLALRCYAYGLKHYFVVTRY